MKVWSGPLTFLQTTLIHIIIFQNLGEHRTGWNCMQGKDACTHPYAVVHNIQ